MKAVQVFRSISRYARGGFANAFRFDLIFGKRRDLPSAPEQGYDVDAYNLALDWMKIGEDLKNVERQFRGIA